MSRRKKHIHTIQLNIEKVIGGTVHMDATEFGAYMSLVISAYQCKNKLPIEDKRLARMARVTGHKWGKIKDIVLPKFKLHPNGHYYHEYVETDLQRIESLSKKNSNNRSGKSESFETSFEDNPLKENETGSPVVAPNGDETVTNTSNKYQVSNTISKDIDKTPLTLLMPDGQFYSIEKYCEYLWNLYPSVGRRKGHKRKFFDQIKKHLKKGEDHEKIINGVTAYAEYCTNKGEYNKDAERWARDAEWHNDYTSGQPVNRSHARHGDGQRGGSIDSIIADSEQAKKMLG